MLKITPKHVLSVLFTALIFTPAAVFAEVSTANPSSDLDLLTMNMRDLTVNETMRYAREMYRKGDYGEAAKAFQSILRKDCLNRLAQYHLQKIAQSGPEFAYLKDYLRKLPCEKYNFNEEDFLPAAFYFEKDNDLLLEQLVAYNKRYRNNKSSLAAKIAEYNAVAAQLERRTQEMTAELNSNRKMSTETIKELTSKMNLARSDARTMDDQVAELKKALALATIEKNRTMEYRKAETRSPQQIAIETHKDKAIAVLKEDLAAIKSDPGTNPAVNPGLSPDTGVPAPSTFPNPSATSAPTANEELTTLQAKFADIQKRLQQIEGSIAEKNQLILDLQKNLEAVK
ncbi:MAG: hypothetical protein HQL20_03265 [Candidatus Omnitrophica bacterium]|nr:hypothetical protein [Candidatus Omnitrophota bacterium]